MISPQQTVTAELRKWRYDPVRQKVDGYIYQDIKDVWEDGDHALIYPVLQWVESANFFLAVTNTACYKCPKDEEFKHVAAEDTPSS